MKISDQIALMADILPAVAQIGEFLINPMRMTSRIFLIWKKETIM